jgi:hypothetical protein
LDNKLLITEKKKSEKERSIEFRATKSEKAKPSEKNGPGQIIKI